MLKGFAAGMLVVLAALVPACRTRRTPPPRTTTQATMPDVPVTATEMRVETTTREDFVRTDTTEPPTPIMEVLPSNIEDLNRMVQNRGFIRDAYFGYDEATLSSDAQSALNTSASWLRQNSRYSLLIEGHCDERGTEQYNLALGDRRANTVREYLVALGIEGSRMRTVSYGEERPFDEGHDESAWAQNRRAHLVLVNR